MLTPALEACLAVDLGNTKLARIGQDRVLDLDARCRIDLCVHPVPGLAAHLLEKIDRKRVCAQPAIQDIDRRLEALARDFRIGVPVGEDDPAERVGILDRHEGKRVQACAPKKAVHPDAGFGTITIEFQPGCQNLSGERLLQYARTRRTENSDIDRARRQQQVLFALRDHVVSTGGVQSIVAQAIPLWNELSGSYRTNLTLTELRQLASLVDDVSSDNIETAVLGPPDYSEPATNAENDQILIPYTGRINQLIGQMFYGAAVSENSGSLQALAQQEGAAVRVFNATTIGGLADSTRTWLTSKGVRVSEIGNASTDVSQTVIRNYGGGRNTALWLADIMGLPPSRVQSGSDGLVSSGVAVILGSDAQTIISAP